MSLAHILTLAVQAAVPPATGNPAQIDQLRPQPAERPARRPTTDKPAQAASIAQLPSTLSPVDDAREADLMSPRPADPQGSRVAGEVARAIGVIRGRGQQVTPELLAREVGPEVLEAYLALQNAPPPAATTVPGEASGKNLPAGTTIIPSGKP